MSYQLFQDIIKKQTNKWIIYVGLNIKGADDLAIEGGEDPADFHVTLLYGYFEPRSDEDDTAVRIQSAIEAIKSQIPETLVFDSEGRFEASESSDGKDVIFANVKTGQLEDLHDAFLKALKEKGGITVEKTFEEYHPHMTLAYIDTEEEYDLTDLDLTATIQSISFGTGEESSHEIESTYPIKKSEETQFNIMKTDDDKRLIFGWASVAIRTDGEQIVDHQQDLIDPEDLEEAVYEYVLNFRDSGEEHIGTLRKKAKMVESCIFTKEKMQAMGIPEGIVPEGWWIGFYVEDDEAWKKVKSGIYQMFSIEGQGIREEVIEKANPYHDELGRFASKNGGGGSSIANRAKPSVMNPDDFDDYVSKNGLKTIYRGYSADSEETASGYFDTMKEGTAPVSGDKSSALGKGLYFSESQEEATGYMQRRQHETGDTSGRVCTAALDVGAKIVDFNELSRNKLAETHESIDKAFEAKERGDTEAYKQHKDRYYDLSDMDITEYATSKGYDAMYEPAMKYTIVINQKALVYRDEKSLKKSDRINGCGILIVKDDKVLTGTRIGGRYNGYICGPGGHLEYGEEPEEAAIREAYEEFGIECKEMQMLGILDGGRSFGKSAIFLCTAYDGEPHTDEEEMTDLKWRTFEELGKERLFYPFEQSLEFIKMSPDKRPIVAKTFNEILKFNPFHDAAGKFSNSQGFASYSANPKTKAGSMAISRSAQAGHGDTMNVHRESQGENINQNYRWMQGGPGAKQLAAQGQLASQQPKQPPKPTKNYDKLGYADHDDADFHQLYNGRQYYQQQKLTATQQKATASYLEAHTEPRSLYSHSQNMNYMMATGQKLTGKYKQTHDGLMSAMHNLGYNVELTRYDHDNMVNGLLGAVGAKGTIGTMSISQMKKALVGTTVNEDKFLSVSYNDFKNAPANSANVFTTRMVKITYKAKASTQAMMPGNGPGGNLGELILAPTNGKSNPGGKIVDIKYSGNKARKKGTQSLNQKQIEIVIEI